VNYAYLMLAETLCMADNGGLNCQSHNDGKVVDHHFEKKDLDSSKYSHSLNLSVMQRV
jgi:hypothetical protein